MAEPRNSLKLPISLDDVLRGKSVEWERLEYKKGWNPEVALHSLCAFANDFHNLGGGYIIIGVEEKDGRPVLPPAGIDPGSLDRIQKELLNLGYNDIQPMYHPLSAPYEIDGKWILVIWVPGGETRPYKAKISLSDKKNDWAYYIRKQSSTVRAKGPDEQELIGLTAKVPFDDRYNQQASIDDLSTDLITSFLREVGSDLAEDAAALPPESLGRQMNIVGGPSEALFPKNAGLLFFNDDPRRFFPATQIDVVWFPDGPGGDQFEEKTFSGPLARMTQEALDYIQRNYLKETVIKHPDRAKADRVWNFPYAAIEEALVNAVYHRSYEIREPVEVRISRNELIVLSYPGPDRSVRLSDLQAGRALPRRYRNRRLGEFLKELDMTEGRSTGIPKILQAMETNGSPPPMFDFDEDHSYFMCRLPAHPAVMAQAKQKANTGQVTPQVTQQVTQQVGVHDGVYDGTQSPIQSGAQSGLSRDQVEIMRKCLMERAIADLMSVVGRSNRTKFRDQVLNPLLDGGLVEMTIPDKPTSSKQKYRLTQKGFQTLETLSPREER
jgi:ATP-dependent DNA helicase RecG